MNIKGRGQGALDWAGDLLREAMISRTHGAVIFSLQDGAIMSARVEAVKKPPVDNNQDTK